MAMFVRKSPFRTFGVLLVLMASTYAGCCLLGFRGGLSLEQVEEVCRECGLEQRFPHAAPERVLLLGHDLFLTRYTSDPRLDACWDLAIYHDANDRVWALAPLWWFQPQLTPPAGVTFEPASMDPFEITGMGLHRQMVILKELEYLKAPGSPLLETMVRRRVAVMQYLLKHMSALLVKSEYVGDQLPHPDFGIGRFYKHEVGPWMALSLYPQLAPAPRAETAADVIGRPAPPPGDYGMPYLIVHRSLLEQER